jgi:hypothetical protein
MKKRVVFVFHDERYVPVYEIEQLEKRVQELEAALIRCHSVHVSPTTCAELVDECFHELFPNEHNPHKK